MIRPQVQDLPVLDFDRFDTFAARGREAAEAALGPWLAERSATGQRGDHGRPGDDTSDAVSDRP